MLANRTEQKAARLAEEFADIYQIEPTSTNAPVYSEVPDLVINATSASLTGNLPVSDSRMVGKHTVCYDLAYKAEPTPFLQWAEEHGAAKAIDGKGMLAEQAAISFHLWTNHQPVTHEVIEWLGKN